MNKSNCPFCTITHPILENDYWFCIRDRYPVTEGHTLIISKEHRKDYFECTEEEKISIVSMIDKVKDSLQNTFKPDGFNVGFNVGKDSGQTIFHTHIHVIPRYKGDTENPRGGVRGVIPSKQNYDE